MRKNKLFLKSLISSTLLLPLATVVISCGNQGDFSDEVSLETDHVVTKQHKAQLIGKTHHISDSQILVKMSSQSSPWLIFNDGFVPVVDNEFVLDFSIDGNIQDNIDFSFDLDVFYNDAGGQPKHVKFNGLHIFYIADIDFREDKVSIRSRTIEKSNSHVFTFNIDFSKVPMSDIIVTMSNEDTGLLNIPVNRYSPGGPLPPRLSVDVELNLGIFHTQAFPFNLVVDFTNSYGDRQSTVFGGCVVSYINVAGEEIPEEYLDIVPNETNEGGYTLKGLKPSITQMEVSKYTKLIIPNHVTDISADAFEDKEWYPDLYKVIIPSSVKTIGEGAFLGFANLTEIDISDYQGYCPDWLTECSEAETEIFDTDHCNAGYIWSNKAIKPDDLTSKFLKIGVGDKWKDFNLSSVVPESSYELSEDKTKLIGFTDKGLETLKNYQVIVIPSTVTTIEEDAFEELKTRPYEKSSSTGVELWTRRLIISKNVKSIPKIAFADCGISGTILLYAEHINTIPSSAFENCWHYGNPSLDNINHEDVALFFMTCYDLSYINSYAFNQDYLRQDTLTLPNNTKGVSEFAFSTCQVKKIVFSGKEETIGNRAFSDSYSQPQGKTITLINLSKFNYPMPKPENEEEETYIPAWFTNYDYAFEGSASDEGKVILSTHIREEVGDDKIDEWEDKFKAYHAIPSDWKIEYV